MNNAKGFTLIELVMVIVILGILAAVAIPRFSDLSNSARDASFQGAIGAVKSGVISYLGENQAYPTEAQLTANGGTAVIDAQDFTLSATDPGNTALSGYTAPTNTVTGDTNDIWITDGTYDVELRYVENAGSIIAGTFSN